MARVRSSLPFVSAPQRLRFGVQLMIGMATIAIAVAVVAGLIIHIVERDYLSASTALEKERFFDLLINSSLDDLIAEDVPEIETTMRLLIERDPELAVAEIANEAGNVLFSWRRTQGSPELSAAGAGLWAADARPLSFTRRVEFAGESFGRVTIGWDMAMAYQEITRHAYSIAFLVGAVCLLLSGLVCLFLGPMAIKPVNAIANRVSGFRQGNYAHSAGLSAFASVELEHLHDSVAELGSFLVQRDLREAELSEAKAMAEAASLAKSAFLANMSHELRTPLNAINGFSEMMELETFGPLGDHRYVDYAKQILSSGNHLLSVINDILDVSKIEAGKEELEIEEIGLKKMVESSIHFVQPRAEEAEVELCADIAADLPTLRGDPRRLRQVMLNLISNAVKFTPSGGRVVVTVGWDEALGAVLTVTDNGIGMAQEHLRTALEPFGQVESSFARKYDGTGLGLPLAKGLIELHGGRLEIESALNQGTKVTIILPPELRVPALRSSRFAAA